MPARTVADDVRHQDHRLYREDAHGDRGNADEVRGRAKIATFVEASMAVIVFEAKERRLKFSLPLPTKYPSAAKLEQQRRSRWRGLFLCIKAKLESVESGIETFEEAFLSHVMTADGQTVYDHVKEPIALSYKTGNMLPLLPGPQNATSRP